MAKTYHVEMTGKVTTIYEIEADGAMAAVEAARKGAGKVVGSFPVDTHCSGVQLMSETVDPAIQQIEAEEVGVHDYRAGHSGMVCDAMVLRDGFGDSCGLPAAHPAHKWRVVGTVSRWAA